jgi:hypothetical protein
MSAESAVPWLCKAFLQVATSETLETRPLGIARASCVADSVGRFIPMMINPEPNICCASASVMRLTGIKHTPLRLLNEVSGI